MRLVLDRDWPTTQVHCDLLDDILSRVRDSIHELYVLDIDTMERWTMWQSLSTRNQELLRMAAEAAAFMPAAPSQGPHMRRVDLGTDWEADAERASRPLLVFVENGTTDGMLLQAALNAYQTPGMATLRAASPSSVPAMEVHHCGGAGSIQAELSRVLGNHPHTRAIVLTDSDTTTTAGAMHTNARRVHDYAAKEGIPCIVLTKRTIENYIPDEVFEAWRDDQPQNSGRRTKVGLLMRSPRVVRDHGDLKGNGVLWTDPSPPGDTLTGFGKRVDQQPLIAVLVRFPQAATAEAFDGRDHARELRSLVAVVEAMI